MRDESPPEQMALLKERCEKKETCDIEPRAIFTAAADLATCPSKLVYSRPIFRCEASLLVGMSVRVSFKSNILKI